MPITKAAKKSLKQREERTTRNAKTKRAFRELVKKIETLVSENKIEEAKKIIPQVYKTIDKAAKKGIIKKNTAARKKARLSSLTSKKEKK